MNLEVSKENLKDFLLNSTEHDFKDLIEYIHPVDLLEVIHDSDEDEAKKILGRLDDETIASLLDEEEDDDRYNFLKQFSEKRQKDILEEMSSDEIADFVGALNEKESSEVLAKMSKDDQEEVKELLTYEPDTAGGLMATEFISIREKRTVLKTFEYLQENAKDAEMPYYLYVIDKSDHLKGVVSLKDMITSSFDTLIADITNPKVVSINVNDDQELVANLFDKYDYVMLPVVDDNDVIKGVITIDDVVDIIKEEATEDIHRMAGLDEEEKVDDNLFTSLKSRLPWLGINLLTAVLAAGVVAKFSGTIEAVVALAAINPIIAGMGGNAGTQSLTLIVRAIALGELDNDNAIKVFWKEFGVGCISGIVIGLVVALGCQIIYGNPYLGLVACLAMIGNMIIATATGFLVPVILKKLNVDPALASSIFVTTFTDCFGFFLFLGLATLVLPKLL